MWLGPTLQHPSVRSPHAPRRALVVATVVGVSVRTGVPSRLVSLVVPILPVVAAIVAALTIGVALGGTAHAQDSINTVNSITPEDGAQLDTSPESIVLVFTQEIAENEVPSVVLGCNLQPYETGLAQIDPDGVVATFEVLQPLPKGTCSLSWFLRDIDGNEIDAGTSAFSVLNDPPPTTSTTPSNGTTADSTFDRVPAVPTQTSSVAEDETAGSTEGALWLGRMLSTMAILIIFGSLALISVGWPEGPEYIVTVRFLRLVWIVGLLGTVLYLIAFAADFNGGAFADGLSPSAWLDLKDAGWPGRAALLRLVFVAACGWVVTRPERIIDPATAMWAWAIPGVALITVAMSRSDGPAPLLGFLIGIVHVFGSAVWFGGVCLVARVVLAGPGEDDLVQATKAFSKISVPAMFLVALTGVAQMIRLDGGDIFSSSHGRVVLLKVVAVAAMLAVGLAARQQVQLRFARTSELTVSLADRFRRAFTAEAAIGVVVLMFSGWLVSLTPARVDPLADEDYLPAISFVDPTSGIDAKVSVAPGRVGPNGLKVEIEAPEAGVSNVVVRLIPPLGAAPCDIVTQTGGCEVIQPIALTGAGTAALLTEDGLPLMVPGTWTLELTAATTQGVLAPGQAMGTFLVADADGSATTSPVTVTTTSPNVQVSVIESSPGTAPLATSTTVATTTTLPPG